MNKLNPYELIMLINKRMQDPVFAQKFNALINELNSIPGLQQEVMRIVQINDDKKRQRAIERLPSKVKKTVNEMFHLLNS
ncbi:MAG: hypothetical protein MR691_06565 [Clostridium sp.]|nr:hypothetical protein [Clostridium sp.]